MIQLQSAFEASARRVQEEITKQLAVEARFTALHKEVQEQLASGLKIIALRVNDLTMNRSRAAMVSEEAARVLRMSDYALLAHTASVEQSMARTRQAWHEYRLESKLPNVMQLRSSPQLLLNEIAVAGLLHQSWSEVRGGLLMLPSQSVLCLSAHRVEEHSAHQRELQRMQQAVAEANEANEAAAARQQLLDNSRQKMITDLESALRRPLRAVQPGQGTSAIDPMRLL